MFKNTRKDDTQKTTKNHKKSQKRDKKCQKHEEGQHIEKTWKKEKFTIDAPRRVWKKHEKTWKIIKNRPKKWPRSMLQNFFHFLIKKPGVVQRRKFFRYPNLRPHINHTRAWGLRVGAISPCVGSCTISPTPVHIQFSRRGKNTKTKKICAKTRGRTARKKKQEK